MFLETYNETTPSMWRIAIHVDFVSNGTGSTHKQLNVKDRRRSHIPREDR
jgi:hypothetical protein